MRRRVLAALVVLLLAAAACGGGGGSDDDGDGSAGSAGDDGGTSGGVVRLGYDMTATRRGGFFWDPTKAGAPTADTGLWSWVYGGLMRPEPDGTLVPDLAETVTVVDPNTVEVVLRSGLELPDGRPFDAQMVKDGLQHNLSQPGLRAFAAEFYKLSSVEVVDPTTVRLTIPDGTAAGWADTFLGRQETMIVPPGTDFNLPAGAGPFRVTEYVPESRAVLEKNPDYWDADSINVDRIELVNTPDEKAGALALRAGQVDWTRADYSTIDTMGAPLEVQATPDPQFVTSLAFCKTTAPFDDPRVRQALSMAVDRDAINDAIFKGKAVIASDLWPDGHRFHDPDSDERYEYDPDAARELLADAGQSDLTFGLMPIAGGGMPELVQVVQQQLAEIGVTVNIINSANFVQDFFIDAKAPVGTSPTGGGEGAGKLRQYVGNQTANLCRYNDPGLNALAQELQTVSSDSDEAVDLWHDIDKTVVDDALSLFLVFQPKLIGWNPERINETPTASYSIFVPEIRELSVKS